MPLREKLAQRATAYLEPGERIQSVFIAQSGPSPYWILLSYWIVVFGGRYVIIVVTDRAILVLRAGRLVTTKPKAMRLRGPRNHWLGRPTGLWGVIRLDREYWVRRRFHKDVVAADQILAAMYPPAPPPNYPPPNYQPQNYQGQGY